MKILYISPQNAVGQLGLWQRIHRERGNEVRLRLVGGWDPPGFRQEIEEAVERWQLQPSMEILDWVEHEQVLELIGSATLGLAALGQEPVFQQAIPNKPFGYMALGLPFVGAETPPMAEMVGKAGAGGLLEKGSAETLADAIAAMLADPARLRTLRENGIRAVRERYNWAAVEKELLVFYQRVLES